MKTYFRTQQDHVLLIVSDGVECPIDSEDLERVSQHSWFAVTNWNSKNHQRQYIQTRIHGKTIYLHRFLMDAPSHLEVDHRDHDTLNNRKSNLRLVTHEENSENRDGPYNTSQLKIRGVSPHVTNSGKKYYAFRCHNKRCKASKYFPFTPEGLELARAFSEDHYSKMMDKQYEPSVSRQPKTGIKGLTIMNHKGQPYRYHARCIVNGKSHSGIFPYSPEGLEEAKLQLTEWRSQ